MTKTQLSLPGGHSLTSVRKEDRDDYVRYLGDGEIAKTIPALPQPYTQETAQSWIRHRLMFLERAEVEICFVIRDPAGSLVGSVGVDDLVPGTTHNGELGVWLGAAHRGHGIAREAVRAFIPYAFDTLGLDRITAHTLHFNAASIRVIGGVGFRLEGRLRRYTRTATGVHDTFVFGLLKEEWNALAE